MSFADIGTPHLSCSYGHEQNDVAKQKHHHIMDIVRSFFWVALFYANFGLILFLLQFILSTLQPSLPF